MTMLFEPAGGGKYKYKLGGGRVLLITSCPLPAAGRRQSPAGQLIGTASGKQLLERQKGTCQAAE
jgi:hypothetical protein